MQLYLVSVHNVRYLCYARPKIAHPELSGLRIFVFHMS